MTMFIKKFPTTAVYNVALETDYTWSNINSPLVNPIYGGSMYSMTWSSLFINSMLVALKILGSLNLTLILSGSFNRLT